MAARVDISAHGVEDAVRMFDQIGQRAMNALPAMTAIMALLIKGEQALWNRSGGKKWAPRADGSKAGRRTGDLERSLTEIGAPGAVREIHADHLVFGTDIFYSRFMQSGTPTEPKRPLLVYRPTDRKKTKTIVELHLLGELP